LFVVGFSIFILTLKSGHYELTRQVIESAITKRYHKEAITAVNMQMLNIQFESNTEFLIKLNKLLKDAQLINDLNAKNGLPFGVNEWDYRLSENDIKYYNYYSCRPNRRSNCGKYPVDICYIWIYDTWSIVVYFTQKK